MEFNYENKNKTCNFREKCKKINYQNLRYNKFKTIMLKHKVKQIIKAVC